MITYYACGFVLVFCEALKPLRACSAERGQGKADLRGCRRRGGWRQEMILVLCEALRPRTGWGCCWEGKACVGKGVGGVEDIKGREGSRWGNTCRPDYKYNQKIFHKHKTKIWIIKKNFGWMWARERVKEREKKLTSATTFSLAK